MEVGVSEEIFDQHDESWAFFLLGCLMLLAFSLLLLIFPINFHLQVFTSSSDFRDPQKGKGKELGTWLSWEGTCQTRAKPWVQALAPDQSQHDGTFL